MRIGEKIKEEVLPRRNTYGKLHGDYSTYEIARDLRVGYDKLKKLILESAETKLIPTSQRKPSEQHAQIKPTPTPTFIQMEIPPLSGQPKQNEWSIEMEKADGTKMKVSGSGLQMPNVALIFRYDKSISCVNTCSCFVTR